MRDPIVGCPFGHESLLFRPTVGEVYCGVCETRYNASVCSRGESE